MLPDNLASCRARYVHSDIPAADHDYSLADRELVAKVHVEQEIDSLVDTVKIDTGYGEVAAAMSAYRNQHGVESLPPQIGNREVAPRRVIELERDVASLENLADLRFHYVARQAILGNPEIKHSAGDRRGFKNCDRITHQREIVRRRKANRPSANDRHFIWKLLLAASFVDVNRML